MEKADRRSSRKSLAISLDEVPEFSPLRRRSMSKKIENFPKKI
jgi:hypothetical protein